MKFITDYLNSAIEVSESIDVHKINNTIEILVGIRKKLGRVFVLGMGGSAANSSHFVNDLRKICNIEAYAPSDNVSEFSASCNDEGVGSYFPRWLATSKLNKNDAIFVMSVGGGSKEKKISMDIVNAIELAQIKNTQILGIVGRDGGETFRNSQNTILIPSVIENLETPLVESFQVLIFHAIVFHPKLKQNLSKWESISGS